MRPLHFTALGSRSGAPPHHPHYLHHNAMRTIQVDLLLKMGEVLQLQLIHWWTPNPTKTPRFNLKMLILVSNHSRRHLWKAVHHNPLLNGPLATIHKHLGTPARVVCCGPLHWVKSPETPERGRTVRALCNNTPQETSSGFILMAAANWQAEGTHIFSSPVPPPPPVQTDSGGRGGMEGRKTSHRPGIDGSGHLDYGNLWPARPGRPTEALFEFLVNL